MATGLDRVLSSQGIAPANEYSEQNRRDREHPGGGQGGPGHGHGQPAPGFKVEADEPAVVLDTHHPETHELDGVAAYKATAEAALGQAITRGALVTARVTADRRPAEVVRHAYEDHGGRIETHAVNLAT
ncbi:hypothetical protein GWI72_18385 [Microvirga tunisiensis]|uniref:Uncharacterized protein n=2 Tax=Pannonibacter tanglangensis TaxID=2750084 RepID=A0A7X5JA80_9HYPH|nr:MULTISPECIES: hypothetical protein [unclassified Pannonibacter]NBN65521.1 hypothetical protein [Pannonibacter sp. XCT-34]NBN80252.1 hypothetical protein [Pannonibacter sp. XCT-53]